MGKQERRAYLDAMRARYRRAGKAGGSAILDEFWAVCGYHRKYALPLWLPHYGTSFHPLSADTLAMLDTISAATIDRLLKPIRAKVGRKGLSGTKPGTLLKKHIPIQTGVWDITQPGFIEDDTVAHCGDSLAGDFVWSLTMTDICTGWTECRATWNKGADGVMAQIKTIQKALPFPVKGFDYDNCSEFLNWHLLRYFQNRKQPIKFTRSHPYHSSDNAHVEQKNWSCVRQLFGYDRLSDPKLVKLMKDIYANEFSMFTNFFCPTLKLASKVREGSQWVRKHGKPITTAQRLHDHPATPKAVKEKLSTQIKTLNPFIIQKQMQLKLKAVFKLLR